MSHRSADACCTATSFRSSPIRRSRPRLRAAPGIRPVPTQSNEGVVMSGTATAIAELTEPTADRAARPRPAALPYLAVADARDAIAWYVDAFGAVAGRRTDRDGRRPHRPRRACDRGRRAVPGRRASRDRAESACAAGGFGEPDAACRRHRRDAGAGARTRRGRCSASSTRTTVSRNATIIDPFGHRWMLSRPGTGAPVAASGTATSATSRCGRRTPTAPPRSTATSWAGRTTR